MNKSDGGVGTDRWAVRAALSGAISAAACSSMWRFSANTYVDVSAVLDKKKRALVAHKSQDGEGVSRQHHEPISQWRGREAGVAAAEAFVHLGRDSQFSKPPGL